MPPAMTSVELDRYPRPTVDPFALGVGPEGERVYVPRDSLPLADPLGGRVPSLEP